MTGPWDEWNHIVKIDPDKDLVDGETYDDVCETGTDAIEIGGTTGITEEKMEAVIDACAAHDVPLYVEPGISATVVHSEDLSGYLVPIVFNAGDIAWMTGAHKEWVRMDSDIDWDRTGTEAYIVLNPESSVAEYTQANCDLDAEEVAAYATVAERMFGQEIIYVEYSGTYGDPDIVASAADALDSATLFYGGGVHDYETAHEMGTHADTVIVGDLVHDAGCDAVRETVRGANDAA
ncbi:phosphoglycerol geranylgeranyltransferase [Halococcus salsus]|uniref:phosphoglycerol geranylgeranyltransferase n=1 Tax=Halococcus salsus TaxID=2162894 RepID=UPI001359B92B|nr:putative phosphoglycerol geranylgeranyltransferase [Halococcus salsus]